MPACWPNWVGDCANCGGGGAATEALAPLGQAFIQLTVIGGLLLRIEQAESRHGDLAEQLLAHFAVWPSLEPANTQRLAIGGLFDHFGIGFKEDNPQQAVEIDRLLMGRNPQPIKVWIE